VDTAGAIDRKRIEQQQHWQQADAVRDGRQASRDPDVHELTRLEDGLRVYGTERLTIREGGLTRLVTQTFCKRLVDGWWQGFLADEEEIAA